MMKEYSFEEVIANIKEGETYKCTSDIYIIQTIHRNEIGLKINNYEPLERCGTNDVQRFVKIETPVSFNDVLHSDKKCRVEHELIDRLINNEENDFDFTEYNEIDDLLFEITNQYIADETRDVLINGRWYIEED